MPGRITGGAIKLSCQSYLRARTYTYDDNSGRATKVAGATTYTTTRVSSKNRVDHISDGTNQRDFTWTANGNMASDDRDGIGGGALANTYGGRDRLESMTVGGNAVTFKVNAFGQRDSKAFSGTTTHYVHDVRGLIIAEANGSTGSTTKEYVWMEGELLAQVDSSGNIVYVHNSHLGAPMKITNPSRTIVWDQISEPFGEVYSTPTSTTPTTHRFPGQIYDSENGLYYNNHRDYDPTMGMYVQHDPIGLAGGLNLYAYAGGNPLQFMDPLGLAFIFVGIGAENPGYFQGGGEGVLLGGYDSKNGLYGGGILATATQFDAGPAYVGGYKGKEYLTCDAKPQDISIVAAGAGPKTLFGGFTLGIGYYQNDVESGYFLDLQGHLLGDGVSIGVGVSKDEWQWIKDKFWWPGMSLK